MRVTVLLIFLFCLHVSAATYAQITLSEKNAPLNKVFRDIKKQSNYQFFYQEELLTSTKRVSISVQNVSVQQALDACLKDQPLSYTIVGNTVVIKEKEMVPSAALKIEALPVFIDITGRVIDDHGQPLSSATVQIKNGKQQVTVTDEKGLFTLKGVETNAIVVITMIGFEKRELPAAANMGDIKLNFANSKLDEVQVIAYGTTTQRLNTGNVISVKSAEIERQPVNNPILALEGRVPGMFITQGNGLPGSHTSVQIRGNNSIVNSGDPLYVVDGVPYSSDENLPSSNSVNILGGRYSDPNPLSFIDPADIESIDILKDADATAIYGSRGANGVILITTKKGKTGTMRIDVNVKNGFGQVAHELPVLNTAQYLAMRHEAFKNDGASPNPNVDYDLTLWDTTRNTDWQKVLTGGKAQYSDLHASVSGGSENTQYLIGAGYHRETAVTPGNFADQKASLNFNISSNSVNKKFKMTLSGIYTYDNNQLPADNFTSKAIQLPPDAPPLYNPDGTINWAPNAQGVSTWPLALNNPVAIVLQTYGVKSYNSVLNSTLSYEILPGVQVKSSFGYTYLQTNANTSVPLASVDPSTWFTSPSYSNFANNNLQSWIVEPQITYTKNISKGIVSVLIGATAEQNTSIGQDTHATGFSSDLQLQNLSAATATNVVATNVIYKYTAIFGRLNYNWEDKYLLNFTGRRDGSSRFGPQNRFADFYAIGAGWIFSKERFAEKNLTWLSYGKLRASYGTTGNDQVGDYSFLDLYKNVTGIGVPYQGVQGLTPVSIYTPNLQWELTRKLEAGLEFGFLKDRAMFNISYYLNHSSNELVPYELPGITGFTTIEKNLPALVQNKGLELELSTVNIKTKNFRWSSSFNLSMNRNKLVSGYPGMSSYYQQLVGYPINSVFVYHFVGVNPITGIDEFASSTGGETTTPNPATDKTVNIDLTPKFFGGFQNSVAYKGFQLDILFQFVKRRGNIYLYNFIPGSFAGNTSGSNQPLTVLSRWQQPGDVTRIERFSQNAISLANIVGDADFSDLSYGDASFIRLKNLSLSWSLPETWTKSINMQKAMIFIQGQNLLTITNYHGLDPETENNVLPPLRVITLGVQVIF